MQYMVQFFNEYNQELTMVKDNRSTSKSAITKSVISQLDGYNFTLPIKHLDWTHNLVLMKQVKDIRARYWYMVQSITSHWTTRYLQEAIKLDYYGKHGALTNKFAETLPEPEACEVQSMLKDPYIFDMLTFTDTYNEQDVGIGLVKHVEKFLMEMGATIDDILCRDGDNRTIGLLLCKTKDRIKAEYSLRDIQKSIGISDYELGLALPKDFR